MLQETLLTAEGLKELEEELEQLKTVGRKEAAEKIKVLGHKVGDKVAVEAPIGTLDFKIVSIDR